MGKEPYINKFLKNGSSETKCKALGKSLEVLFNKFLNLS